MEYVLRDPPVVQVLQTREVGSSKTEATSGMEFGNRCAYEPMYLVGAKISSQDLVY